MWDIVGAMDSLDRIELILSPEGWAQMVAPRDETAHVEPPGGESVDDWLKAWTVVDLARYLWPPRE